MEVRGEHRGFMETMRAFFTTIRKRIGQWRTRQKTKNYRICRNLAMAKIESEKERRLKKPKVTKVIDTKGRIQEEDGAPRGLRERMLSALRAFREGRKRHWVCRRGWRKNMDGLKVEETRAGEDLCGTQAREDIHTKGEEDLQTQANPWIHAREDIQTASEDIQTWAGQNPQTQASLEIQSREDIQAQTAQDHLTQAGDDIQAQVEENLHDTQASLAGVDIQTQTEEDLQTQASPEIRATEDIQTEAGENLNETQTSPDTQAGESCQGQAEEDLSPAEPLSWVVSYGQMWQKMAQQQKMARGDCVLYREDFHDTQAMEDVQAAEPASWVVAYAQMWQSMAQQDDPVLCVDCHGTQARESLDDILAREDLEAVEPASWFVANAQVWGSTHKDNSSFICSTPIMNSWLSSVNMQGRVNTSSYKYMDMF